MATALGGLCTGLIGLAVPYVVGTGYGWAQFAISEKVSLIPPVMLLVAAIAEIVSASFTLGSGNSGGIFGPCVVTGGMFGGAFGYAAAHFFPSAVPHPGTPIATLAKLKGVGPATASAAASAFAPLVYPFFDELRKNPHLSFLNAELYPEWKTLDESARPNDSEESDTAGNRRGREADGRLLVAGPRRGGRHGDAGHLDALRRSRQPDRPPGLLARRPDPSIGRLR